MGPHTRGANPEEEYFARRELENERERERREAVRQEREAIPPAEPAQRDGTEPPGGPKGPAKIVAAVSTAMKALFGIRGNRRPRHA